jgi:hypothetical protein
VIRQAFGEERLNCTRGGGLNGKVQTDRDRKRRDRRRAKSRPFPSFSLTSRVCHTTVTFYGDCVKMCEDFAQNFSVKRTSYCFKTTSIFSPGNLLKRKNMTIPSHPDWPDLAPCNIFSVSPIEVESERPPFLTQLT